MKYLITAPPGALGHFLSRVLNNDYDFDVGQMGQYHGLKKNYSAQTTFLEDYQGYQEVDQKIICLHNFDNRDFRSIAKDRVVVNVVVNGCWEIYFNNFWRKAMMSNTTKTKQAVEDINKKFPNSNNSLREEFYWLYLNAVQGKVEWLPITMHGIQVFFCDFYGLESFKTLLKQIPESVCDNIDDIWNHFIKSQSVILSRTQLYQKICEDIIQGNPPQIPDYFDNIDFGIMSGMIQHQQGIDVLNLENNSWI
jgi:hypothetical protein